MRTVRRKRQRQQPGGRISKRRQGQKRGILPLAAAIPAIIAAGKAAGFRSCWSHCQFWHEKALEAMTRKQRN